MAAVGFATRFWQDTWLLMRLSSPFEWVYMDVGKLLRNNFDSMIQSVSEDNRAALSFYN